MAKRKKGSDPTRPFETPIGQIAEPATGPQPQRRIEITAAQVDGPTSYGRLWNVTCPAHPEIPAIVVEAHDAAEAVRACRLVRRRDYGDFPLFVERINPETDEPAKPAVEPEPAKTNPPSQPTRTPKLS